MAKRKNIQKPKKLTSAKKARRRNRAALAIDRRKQAATLIQAKQRAIFAKNISKAALADRRNNAATLIQSKQRAVFAKNISKIEQQVTFIHEKDVYLGSLTDKQKEIFIGSLEYAYNQKYKLIQDHLLSLLINDQILKRRKENLQEISVRDKVCQQMARASQQRLKRVREIKTLSYMARVFNSKKLDSFLKNYHLTRILGILSFSIYSLRLLTNLCVIACTFLKNFGKSCFWGLLGDQWSRRGTNIFNDAVWSGINLFDFLIFIGQVSLSSAPIVLPIINFVGYVFDLWNEINDMKKTIKNYDKIFYLTRVGANNLPINRDINGLIEKDKLAKINKHRLSIAIAANLLLFNFAASIVVIAIVVAAVSNPIGLGFAFSTVAFCALTTVLCSRIKGRYNKDRGFRGKIDKIIGVKDEDLEFNLSRSFSWGFKLFKIYIFDLKSRAKKCCPCVFRDNIDGSRARISSGAILSLGSVAALVTLAATGVLATFAAPAILGIVAIGVIGGYLIKTGLSNLNLAKTQETSQGDDSVPLG